MTEQLTDIETLTPYQVQALQAEAESAGDEAMAEDCRAVDAAYWLAKVDDLQSALAESSPEVREAAGRIVAAIRNAEAQAETCDLHLGGVDGQCRRCGY